MTEETNQSDIDAVLARRHDNGGDYWATADRRLAVGDPFSTLTALLVLHELGVPPAHEAVHGALALLLDAWRADGRYRLAPTGTLYPCHTAAAARVLCRFGHADHPKLKQTFNHLLEGQYTDGGWRCSKFPWGRGPDTDFSNPGVTLAVLDAVRFTEWLNNDTRLDRAVETLLEHWVIRRPIGPCQFGIGTLFMQVEYPFLRYNLFSFVYVLSFFDRARDDPRYREAARTLGTKLDDQGRIIVERPNRNLAHLQLCTRGQPSVAATARYREILDNLRW